MNSIELTEHGYCSGCENPVISNELCHYCYCSECGRKKDHYDDLWLKENQHEATDPCQSCCEDQEEPDDSAVPKHIRGRGWQAIQAWETGVSERGPI